MNDIDRESGSEFMRMVEDYQMTLDDSHQLLKISSKDIADVIESQRVNDHRLSSRIVKLHDIIASCQKGEVDASRIVRTVAKALLMVLQNTDESWPFLNGVLSSAFINYSNQYHDILSEEIFTPMLNGTIKVPLLALTNLGRDSFFRSVLKFCDSGDQVYTILKGTDIQSKEWGEMSKRLLFRISGLDTWQMHANLVCFLRRKCDSETFFDLFEQSLTLWSDPIISKAYVYHEVIHYTKLSLLFFSHLSAAESLNGQDSIIKFVAQGLPNHFSSTDHRSIQLAKFFCEILTESLKLYEKRTPEIPKALKQPDEEINTQLLRSMHACERADNFWHSFELGSLPQTTTNTTEIEEKVGQVALGNDVIDEDDDDDLEPIESLEAPVQSTVAYLRDFIETLSEETTYDEKLANFSALPIVVKHQITHEHPQVGMDLLNLLVKWENDFDCVQMEVLRKRSLCNTLLSKMDGNVQHLCSMLPQDSTRVPQQILILDVLSTTASEASLSNLQILAQASFNIMLQVDLFETRDVPVRVPAIIFFHRLLSTLPIQMVRSEMINNYLKALSYMTNVDKATEQTISYSLHNLMDRMRHVQFANEDETKSPNLSAGLAEMRAWMWNLQEKSISSSIHNMSDSS